MGLHFGAIPEIGFFLYVGLTFVVGLLCVVLATQALGVWGVCCSLL